MIVFNGCIQLVEYEALPTVCFECGIYGHVCDYCLLLNVDNSSDAHATPKVLPIPLPSENFGLWMVVKKCQRCRSTREAKNGLGNYAFGSYGSRFNPIFDVADEEPSREVPEDTVHMLVNSRTIPQKPSPSFADKGKSPVTNKQHMTKGDVYVRMPVQQGPNGPFNQLIQAICYLDDRVFKTCCHAIGLRSRSLTPGSPCPTGKKGLANWQLDATSHAQGPSCPLGTIVTFK
ncbi:hypothetical protein V6N12_047024 [Hibiscus sabdariffa]|uniref:CCHC-type domain-containing protein n=1 Tax=Hibiscus sabdariffa TaxID=183260 RepID=A0ABR2AT28_9ROSI